MVGELHRHNVPPRSGLFAVGVETAGELAGVAIVGRPVARLLDDGRTAEVTRVATDGTANACSMLYGAAARAARALGYGRIITYTLATEPGTSLRAAGWTVDGQTDARESWARASRPRVQRDLFGNDRRPAGPKIRWTKAL